VAGWRNPTPQRLEDRWVLSRLSRLTSRVGRELEEYQLGEAEQAIYDFLWDDYCDWYIEASKVRLRDAAAASPLPVLVHVLEKTLRLLHPFMPFITEELWQALMRRIPTGVSVPPSIVVAPYPEANESLLDPEAEADFSLVQQLIRTVRNARAEFRIDPRRPLEVAVAAGEMHAVLESQAPAICFLAAVDPLRISRQGSVDHQPGSLRAVIGGLVLSIPLGGLVDMAAERQRLGKELQEAEVHIGRLEARLQDQQFINKAPEDVVERERGRQRDVTDRSQKLRGLLAQLGET
jgi:valyl-tRNA synthetase